MEKSYTVNQGKNEYAVSTKQNSKNKQPVKKQSMKEYITSCFLCIFICKK